MHHRPDDGGYPFVLKLPKGFFLRDSSTNILHIILVSPPSLFSLLVITTIMLEADLNLHIIFYISKVITFNLYISTYNIFLGSLLNQETY